MSTRSLPLAGLAVLLGLGISAGAQTSVSFTPQADTFVRFGVNQTSNFGTATFLDMFANGTVRDYFGYVRFDLSSIPDDATITSAKLTFTKVDGLGSTRSDAINAGRFRVLGLLDVAGNTAQDWSETGLTFDTRGSEWTAANTFEAARIADFDGSLGTETISGTGSGSKASIAGENLMSFLTGRLSGNNVTFIVDQAGTDAGRGYGLASREYAVDATAIPLLEISYLEAVVPVPEPASGALLLAGFGLLATRRFRRA